MIFNQSARVFHSDYFLTLYISSVFLYRTTFYARILQWEIKVNVVYSEKERGEIVWCLLYYYGVKITF